MIATPWRSLALQPTDAVKISEICYDPSEVPETMFEFVELFNAGDTTVFLDGAVISDQGNSGSNETTFQFPGTPLTGTSIPLAPGAFWFWSAAPREAPTRSSTSSFMAA